MYGWYSEKQRLRGGIAVYNRADGTGVVSVTQVCATPEEKPNWDDAVMVGEVDVCVQSQIPQWAG